MRHQGDDATSTDNGFYRAFEDRYRGSRELILSRLRNYLPLIEPLKQLNPSQSAGDLGCGRGEWLELLREVGFSTKGVDLDDGMLTACREAGLDVAKMDAVEFLRELPNSSQVIVTGFHIAEHLPFATLHNLLREVVRVLCPGGVLILETPNPENISVATSSFYLDPTHQRPIPPGLLSFMFEWAGLARARIIRLYQPNRTPKADECTMSDVLFGVSPDYAVFGQKIGDPTIAAYADCMFAVNAGASLTDMCALFDGRLSKYEAGLVSLGSSLEETLEETMVSLRAEMTDAMSRERAAVENLKQLNDALYAQSAAYQKLSEDRDQRVVALTREISAAHARAREAQEILCLLTTSTSWRLTAPFRRIADLLRRMYSRL